MQRWTPQHAKFVGRVIFSNFLSLPLENYESIIEEIEKQRVFKRLFGHGCDHKRNNAAIIVRRLSKATPLNDEKNNRSSAVVAKIETRLRPRLRRGTRRENRFTIRYACEGFNKMYVIDSALRDELATDSNIRSMLFRFRRISSRNALTHELLRGIIEHQEEFLSTGNPTDLVPLSQIQLTKWMNRVRSSERGSSFAPPSHKATDGHSKATEDKMRNDKNLSTLYPSPRRSLRRSPGLLSTSIDNSWVSRLVNGLSVIIPSGEEKTLKSFFQTQKDVNKRLIKQILDNENQDLESGKLKKPYTDNEIRLLLEDRLRLRVTPKSRNASMGQAVVTKPVSSKGYGHVTELRKGRRNPNRITLPKDKNGHSAFARATADRRDHNRLPSISRHSVGHCRKDMGIPPAKRRLSGYKYPPLSANFSMLYPLCVEAVQGNAPASPGVYEFRLKGQEIEYPKGKTKVIYIGSAKNLKKRIKEHLRANNKNGHIRDFLRKSDCSFRYIQFSTPHFRREEEKGLYKLFTATYGAPPRCNRVRP